MADLFDERTYEKIRERNPERVRDEEIERVNASLIRIARDRKLKAATKEYGRPIVFAEGDKDPFVSLMLKYGKLYAIFDEHYAPYCSAHRSYPLVVKRSGVVHTGRPDNVLRHNYNIEVASSLVQEGITAKFIDDSLEAKLESF